MHPTLVPPSDRSQIPNAERLQRAITRVLRPLVRLAILSGLTFPTLSDLLRSLYVDVAANDLLVDKRSQTDSRISVLTGVHRKEIRRQRQQDTAFEPPGLTLSSQVMARWLGLPDFTGPDGRPKPLPRLGGPESFETLVSAVTKDVRPRTLLDAWIDQGLVTLDAEGLVHLQSTAFIPHGDRATQLFYFTRNLHDHLAAASGNVVASGAPPFLDRSVHYDGLSAAAAAAIEETARDAAIQTLLEVNRRALAIADADEVAQQARGADAPQPLYRVNLGIYLFSEADQSVVPQ